ncbi:MAG: DUF86 domain-containing protein [Lachnospiraceae bacterium]|nr:DUF86 domain-containing protein [Lachnospiraceae bacterium]
MKNEIVLSKMLGYITKIQKYTANMTYEEFVADELVLEACIFNLSQLGELSNKPDAAFKASHAEIPWNQIYGLRNRIVHDYEGVNYQLVWEIITEDLPALQNNLKILL